MTAITELSPIYADFVDENRQDRMIVSIRDYDQVRAGLRLPSSLLASGGKVVSVGEGLTDFARTARDRFGTDITAVDPIYSVITDEIPVRAAEAKLYTVFGGRTELIDFSRDFLKRTTVPLPYEDQRHAGSAYELELADASVDLVLAHRLPEHIDLARAIPQLARVLKEPGEVRMGPLLLMATTEGKLKNGRLVEGEEGFEFAVSPGNVDDAMGWIAAHPSLSPYVVVGDSILQDTDFYHYIDLLIIRNDNQIPVLDEARVHTQDSFTERYTISDSLMRLNPVAQIDRWGDINYELTPTMR